MKMTETLNQDIAKFEKATGKVVSPRLMDLIAEMAAVEDKFEALGRKDACGGLVPLTKEAFIRWGKRELIDPEGEDDPIVELMYMSYMDGFKKAEVVHEG